MRQDDAGEESCSGLLAPTSGEVLIDGIPLSTLGPRVYREHIAAVMQEDQLLSGSIAENICFFDVCLDRREDDEMRRDGRHPRRDHAYADGL